MKYLKTSLISIAIIILIALLTVKIYYHSPLPQYEGTLKNIGLVDTVDIFTDEYGVPHIFAQNNEDVFFTAGYIIARERLFQLSILSAVMNGKISTLLGEDFAVHDEYLQQNDIFSINDIDNSIIDEEKLRLINKYCDGINSYIDELDGSYPLSFKITKSQPLKWTAKDAINVLFVMSNNIAHDNRKHIINSAIRNYFGEHRYVEMVGVGGAIDSVGTTPNVDNIRIENEILDLIGASGSAIGGKAIIFNDSQVDTLEPILVFQDVWGLTQPTKWFDMHLKGGNLNIEGAFIPGFPLPLVGKNDKSVWANTDFYSTGNINQSFEYAVDTSSVIINSDFELENLNDFTNKLGENIRVDDIIKQFSDSKNERTIQRAKSIANIYLANSSNNKNTINSLLNWNGDESANSAETLFIHVIYKNLIENIFKDELSLIGEDIYDIFLKLPEFAEESLFNILNNPESNWLDDINTHNRKENLIDVVVKSVDDAIQEIKTEYGVSNWQWGDVSKREYQHYLGSRKLINFIRKLNIGPFSAEGSINNINVNEFDYSNDFAQKSGIVIRRIFDLSDVAKSYSILPTGQSGLTNSKHYYDQAEIFTNKMFRTIEFVEDDIRNSNKYQKLTLIPSK